MEPLTLAGILANSGTPFAALNALSTQPLRIRSRERSGPQARGSERLQPATQDSAGNFAPAPAAAPQSADVMESTRNMPVFS